MTVLSRKAPSNSLAPVPHQSLDGAVELGGGDRFVCGERTGGGGAAVCHEVGGNRVLSLVHGGQPDDARRHLKTLGDVNHGTANTLPLCCTFEGSSCDPATPAGTKMTGVMIVPPASGQAMRTISLEGYTDEMVAEMIAAFGALLVRLVSVFHAIPFYANYSPIPLVETGHGREAELFLSFYDHLGWDAAGRRFYLLTMRDLLGFPEDVTARYAALVPAATEDFARFLRQKFVDDNDDGY